MGQSFCSASSGMCLLNISLRPKLCFALAGTIAASAASLCQPAWSTLVCIIPSGFTLVTPQRWRLPGLLCVRFLSPFSWISTVDSERCLRLGEAIPYPIFTCVVPCILLACVNHCYVCFLSGDFPFPSSFHIHLLTFKCGGSHFLFPIYLFMSGWFHWSPF